MVRLMVLGLVSCTASSATTPPAAEGTTVAGDSGTAPRSDLRAGTVLTGATVLGAGPCGEAPCDVRVEGVQITAVGPPGTVSRVGDRIEPLDGGFLVPAFIDSHVHFAYLDGAEAMARGGVAGAVDLAAPRDTLAQEPGPVRMVRAGPMLTAVGGYPTRSWGRNGYGWELASADEARAAVATLVAEGAAVIKSPVGSDGPDPTVLAAIGEAAAAAGAPFAAHALDDGEARAAASAGATVLAHTPVQPLSPAAVRAWGTGAVISTVAAFGGADSTVANLQALRAAGATVLYGTDFGNTRTAGIDPRELSALTRAGLDGAAIIEAGTSAPAEFWGFSELGSIAPARAASFLWTETDPRIDPGVLAAPDRVWIDGVGP